MLNKKKRSEFQAGFRTYSKSVFLNLGCILKLLEELKKRPNACVPAPEIQILGAGLGFGILKNSPGDFDA